MQSTNFVAIMAILNAIVQRFNNDTIKTHLASLVQPLAADVGIGALADTKTK